MSSKLLTEWFPGTQIPVISAAPMFTATNGKLAAAVSGAGGLGMFGAGFDFSPNSEQLATLDAELSVARKQLGLDTEATLPVVVGLLSTLMTIEAFKDNVSPILSKHKPCAIWLFCPVPPTGHAEIISHAHSLGADWGLKAFVQAGTVAAARDAVKDGADIIVAQGVDAGGHQWKNGSGIISIVPEVKDMLKAEFADRQIPVLAAGGIVDGRGVVAALALGADGVCMGTRFVVCEESQVPEETKDLVISASDGGVSTIKSTIHDDIQGSNIFHELYDARALIGNSYRDYLNGVSAADLLTQHNAAKSAKDESRSIQFIGAAVGIVKQKGKAGEIVKEIRSEADRIIAQLKA